MNERQFQKYYSKLKKNPNLELITDHIFRAFDMDHSGKMATSCFLFQFPRTLLITHFLPVERLLFDQLSSMKVSYPLMYVIKP